MIKHSLKTPEIQTNNVTIETLPQGYVRNPNSGKLVKVGGKMYNKLMMEGTVDHVPVPPTPKAKNPNIVAECKNSILAKGMKTKLQQEQPLPDNQVYAITNDQKRVIVRQKKPKSLKVPDMTDMVSRAVSRVHKKLAGHDADLDDTDENRELFKQMIEQELILLQRPKNNIPSNNIKDDETEESESDED
mgnify:CR=1 FL=1